MALASIANPEDGRPPFVIAERGEGWTVVSGAEQIQTKEVWARQDALLVRFGLTVGLVHPQQFRWEDRPAQGVEEAR